MASIKNTVNFFQSNQKNSFRGYKQIKQPQEIVELFEKEYEKIQSLIIRNFRFNVLTEEEKAEALGISKYILEIKLQNAFDQIQKDFKIFLPYIIKFKRLNFSASYSITTFDIKVNLTDIGFEDIVIPRFEINQIEANSRFKEYAEKYLAYELVSIYKDSNKAVCNSFLNENDIQLFFKHYEDLLNGENEIKMNSTFQGEGGILLLNAELKPMKLLKTSIAFSILRILIYFILTITLISLAINYKFFTILVIGTFTFGILILNLINEEYKQLISLTEEYRTHE
jgi:hypothetical protein